jgi:hypothetical protein
MLLNFIHYIHYKLEDRGLGRNFSPTLQVIGIYFSCRHKNPFTIALWALGILGQVFLKKGCPGSGANPGSFLFCLLFHSITLPLSHSGSPLYKGKFTKTDLGGCRCGSAVKW